MADQIGTPVDDISKYDANYRILSDHLNIDVNRDWSRYKQKVEYITNWAKKVTGSEDIKQLVSAVKKLDKHAGPHSWEDRKINHLYRNLRLEEDGLNKLFIKKDKGMDLKTLLRGDISKMVNEQISKEQSKINQAKKQIKMTQKIIAEKQRAETYLEGLEKHKTNLYSGLQKALLEMNNWKDRRKITKV